MPTKKRKDSVPILFGKEKEQMLLRTLLEEGSLPAPKIMPRRLITARLVSIVRRGHRDFITLNSSHPAYRDLCGTLRALYGVRTRAVVGVKRPGTIDGKRPLGHQSHVVFQIVREVVRAAEPLTFRELEKRIPDAWPNSITLNVDRLKENGVVVVRHGKVALSSNVPDAFIRFVQKTSKSLANGKSVTSGVDRVAAFLQAKDRAPLLFGSDLRLRTLMALAKHGPMTVADLRRLLGGANIRPESSEFAMYGRAGVVVEWKAKDGRCVALDPRFPVEIEFKAFLRAMERYYPLRAYHLRDPVPKVPRLTGKWEGDQRAIFGGPIATAILVTIAALGWSFEALCVMYAVGYDRVVTKDAVRRLEEYGIIAGDRKKKPGFNVRVLRVSESFCAAKELKELLHAYICAWPELKREVITCLDRLAPRTKAHLRKRKLIEWNREVR